MHIIPVVLYPLVLSVENNKGKLKEGLPPRMFQSILQCNVDEIYENMWQFPYPFLFHRKDRLSKLVHVHYYSFPLDSKILPHKLLWVPWTFMGSINFYGSH